MTVQIVSSKPRDLTIFASAARTADPTPTDRDSGSYRGVIVTLDVTAITDTPSITLAIEHKDPVSGNYEQLLVATAVTATGRHSYIVYPGADTTAREDIVEISGWPLGRVWRVTVTHADADSITYSVGASYIP